MTGSVLLLICIRSPGGASGQKADGSDDGEASDGGKGADQPAESEEKPSATQKIAAMFARAIVVDVEADAESKRLRGELEPPAAPPDEDDVGSKSSDEGSQSEEANQTGPAAKAGDAIDYEDDHNYDHFGYEYVGEYYLDRHHEEL